MKNGYIFFLFADGDAGGEILADAVTVIETGKLVGPGSRSPFHRPPSAASTTTIRPSMTTYSPGTGRLHSMLGATTYFCDANESRQKRRVENANGRIRLWLPTSTP